VFDSIDDVYVLGVGSYGLWTVEAPGEIFPDETVLFGTEAEKASHGSATGTEGSVKFAVLNGESGEVSHCFLQWCNPMLSGERGKWWDCECDAPLRVDAICSQDDNNKVTFRLLHGSGTARKYGAAEDGETAGPIVVPVLTEEEVASEMTTRREMFNTQHLPQLIIGQMKATRTYSGEDMHNPNPSTHPFCLVHP